jgi:hypothetical protein
MPQFAGRAAEIRAAHRDEFDADLAAAVERFLADPREGAGLARVWARASPEARERCARLAAAALASCFDQSEPCIPTLTAMLAQILAVFVGGTPGPVLDLVQLYDYRADRFCRYLLALTEMEGGLPPRQWLQCVQRVALVCTGDDFKLESEEAARALVLSGRLLRIARSSFGDYCDDAEKEAPEVVRKTLYRMSALMGRGYSDCDIEDGFLELTRDFAPLVGACSEIDAPLLRFAQWNPEKLEGLTDIVCAGYAPIERETLMSIVAGHRSREHLLQVLRLMAGLYPTSPLDPDPHESVELPFTIDRAIDFFEHVKAEGLVTLEEMNEFVEAAVRVTGDSGIVSWLPIARMATPKPAVIKTILGFRPSVALADEFFSYLWELQQREQLQIDRADIFTAILELAVHLGSDLSLELRASLADALPAIFRWLLARPIVVYPYGAYELQPSFSPVYNVIQALCGPGELEPFMEMAAIRYRQLFVLIFHSYGSFMPGLELWAEFIDFHQFLLQNTGLEISFPGELPAEFVDLPLLCHNCLILEGQPRALEMQKLQERLGCFERYVHECRFTDDSRFLEISTSLSTEQISF